jgi:SAM-dependent methyltransferase
MVSRDRWLEAQEAEKRFFVSNKSELRDIQKGWFLGQLSRWSGFAFSDLSIFEGKTIVEVGCGASGFISVLGGIGIDPLVAFYQKLGELSDGKANHIRGVGEFLPILNESTDVVVCYNVIDHVKNPNHVLNEIHRILKCEGLLLFQAHFFSRLYAWACNLHDRDLPHPFHITFSELKKSLRQSGFDILRGVMIRSLNGKEAQSKRRLYRLVNKLWNYDLFDHQELRIVCKRTK